MLQISQFRELGTNRVQMPLPNIAHLDAVACIAGRQRDHRPRLIDGKVKVPAVPNQNEHFLHL